MTHAPVNSPIQALSYICMNVFVEINTQVCNNLNMLWLLFYAYAFIHSGNKSDDRQKEQLAKEILCWV